MKKDYLTFLKILRECEAKESENVKRMEAANNS